MSVNVKKNQSSLIYVFLILIFISNIGCKDKKENSISKFAKSFSDKRVDEIYKLFPEKEAIKLRGGSSSIENTALYSLMIRFKRDLNSQDLVKLIDYFNSHLEINKTIQKNEAVEIFYKKDSGNEGKISIKLQEKNIMIELYENDFIFSNKTKKDFIIQPK